MVGNRSFFENEVEKFKNLNKEMIVIQINFLLSLLLYK